jgi:hypothetical protein
VKLFVALAVLVTLPAAAWAVERGQVPPSGGQANPSQPAQPCTFPPGYSQPNDRFVTCGGAVLDRRPEIATKPSETVNRLPRQPPRTPGGDLNGKPLAAPDKR